MEGHFYSSPLDPWDLETIADFRNGQTVDTEWLYVFPDSPSTRYRQVPTFGKDTIRRFRENSSELKKMAARDFEDLLQVRRFWVVIPRASNSFCAVVCSSCLRKSPSRAPQLSGPTTSVPVVSLACPREAPHAHRLYSRHYGTLNYSFGSANTQIFFRNMPGFWNKRAPTRGWVPTEKGSGGSWKGCTFLSTKYTPVENVEPSDLQDACTWGLS